MSAETPESIPTSADPRSQRPTKRRALSPSSAQAASVSALFSKPDRDIRISSSGRPTHSHSRPPEIVTNVQGSSAGAGSGEFHVYKAARRREYERLRAMDEDVRRERDQEVFEREKDARERRDEERTRKNRERREKMKARKGKAKTGGGGGNGNGGTGGIKPAKVGEDRGKEDENMQESKHVTAAPAAEPGLVIHDDD